MEINNKEKKIKWIFELNLQNMVEKPNPKNKN
jgi:hypothetical protein